MEDSGSGQTVPPLQGSCHCGLTRFQITATPSEVRVCNCSICQRRGALIFRVKESDFKLLTPIENLSVYQWNTMVAKDYFCKVCGILPFRRPRTAPEMWAVNVGCLEGIEIDGLAIEKVFGKKLSLVQSQDG